MERLVRGRLVDSLLIPEYHRSFDTVPTSRTYPPKPGNYSTEPGLTALTVSSGTVTPAFHSHTLNYTVPNVPNADGRITLTTTAKADYYTVAFIPGSLYAYSFFCSYGGQQTSVSYQDDTGNPLYPLTDADADTPGFQMELDEGENVFKIRVWPNCESGHIYKLTVTRAGNAPATGQPTISGTAQVGETLTADTSSIEDADGLSGVTFSYQWLGYNEDGDFFSPIFGATESTYTVPPGSVGEPVKVWVTFTDDANNEEMLTSEPTEAVAATSPVTIELSPSGSVEEGTEITVTMSFSGLKSDSDTSTTDYDFRADVKDADACEGVGMGRDRYMYKVDENPEVRTANIAASCEPGDYTVEVSISSPGNVELASATADFTVNAPGQQQPEPLSTDATLSGLTLGDVTLGAFGPTTTGYTANVANDVTQTTVTPTTNDDGATYEIKLDGVTDADGVIPLAVGGNVITVEVTAEDGNTTRTYTVTVTRAAPTASGPAVAIALSPPGSVEPGTEIGVTMRFSGLESDSDTGTHRLHLPGRREGFGERGRRPMRGPGQWLRAGRGPLYVQGGRGPGEPRRDDFRRLPGRGLHPVGQRLLRRQRGVGLSQRQLHRLQNAGTAGAGACLH